MPLELRSPHGTARIHPIGATVLCAQPRHVDTHQQGERLHRITRRTDVPLRDELLLFIPPGAGRHNERILSWFAWAGYTSINLSWQNELADGQDDDASWRELVYGTGTLPEGDIAEHDALLGRLNALMAYLVMDQPSQGWDRWWTETGGMQWDKVVLVGWSDGASAATYLGRDQAVAGLIAISGPKYKEWLLDARQTPGCAHRLVYHQEETLPDETLALLIDGLDLDPTVVDVDTSSPPYGDAQILTTAHTDFRADHCTVHKAVAMDPCLPEALFETYLHLACAAPTACPP